MRKTRAFGKHDQPLTCKAKDLGVLSSQNISESYTLDHIPRQVYSPCICQFLQDAEKQTLLYLLYSRIAETKHSKHHNFLKCLFYLPSFENPEGKKRRFNAHKEGVGLELSFLPV